MPSHFMPSKPAKPKVPNDSNRVRIIGGTWRSRVIAFPGAGADGLRPTANRVRETLFNWLGQTLHGKRCLDMFSGSGALGFEAASRGAMETVMLETHPATLAALKINQQNLAATTCRVMAMDALKFIESGQEKFDVVFVDPPFASGIMATVLRNLPDSVLPGGVVYAEWGSPIEELLDNLPDQPWEIVKQGRAGAVHFALLRTTLLSANPIPMLAENKR